VTHAVDTGHGAADDRRLVDAVLGGDREAFRVLVEREADTVLGVCRRILREPAEAEDAAQDAFVLAYRKLGSYRGDGPLGGWLVRIAIRAAQERRRRTVPTVTFDEEIGLDALRLATDPTDALEAVERDEALHAAIDALPPHLRDAVHMRYLDGLSYAQIALATGRPEASVRTHLHRGLDRLRSRLGPQART
jgi:RNA polymerase sigma-70 factor (ECF subfamily)